MGCEDGNGSDAARRKIRTGRARLETASPAALKNANGGTEAVDPGIETLTNRAATASRDAAHDALSQKNAFALP